MVKFADNSTDETVGVGLVTMEVRVGEVVKQHEVLVYVVNNEKWSKILIGKDVLVDLGITPEQGLLQKKNEDLEAKLAELQK